jgi:hypothetical protein
MMVSSHMLYKGPLLTRMAPSVVISCASAMDLASCVAMVEGLGERHNASNNYVLYIHVSVSLAYMVHNQ